MAKSGADPNAGRYDVDGKPIQTPLHEAIQLDDLGMARLLIACGASIHAQPRWKGTPLHLAAHGGNASTVELLLSHGADPNAKDWNGKTPRDYAQEAGFKDAIRLLGGDLTKAKSGPYKSSSTWIAGPSFPLVTSTDSVGLSLFPALERCESVAIRRGC